MTPWMLQVWNSQTRASITAATLNQKTVSMDSQSLLSHAPHWNGSFILHTLWRNKDKRLDNDWWSLDQQLLLMVSGGWDPGMHFHSISLWSSSLNLFCHYISLLFEHELSLNRFSRSRAKHFPRIGIVVWKWMMNWQFPLVAAKVDGY